MFFYGFFSMTVLGAGYDFLPRILDTPARPNAAPASWKGGLVAAHFWFSLVGVGTLWLSLLIGGVIEGLLLSNPANSFLEAMKASLPAIRGSTLGLLLLAGGTAAFLANYLQLLWQSCCSRCCQGKAPASPSNPGGGR
jgi:cytochrome c oxidase cbb3-type subunit 1